MVLEKQALTNSGHPWSPHRDGIQCDNAHYNNADKADSGCDHDDSIATADAASSEKGEESVVSEYTLHRNVLHGTGCLEAIKAQKLKSNPPASWVQKGVSFRRHQL